LASRFGAAQSDLDAVSKFVRKAGLKVIEASIARRTVVAAGTVSQMEKAFAVELAYFQAPTQRYRGRVGHVHLPKELAKIVEGVFGLDNRCMARRAGGASNDPVVTPRQVADLYNWPSWLQTPPSQTIGLIEFSGGVPGPCGYHPQDITDYFTTNKGIGPGFLPPTLTDVLIDGATNSPGSSNDSEVVLDIQVAGAIAQGANIAVYFAPFTEQGWVDAITTAVHDKTNLPSVLSISWGWTEHESINQDGVTFAWTDAAMAAVSATFQEAATLGVTVFVASGDDGSNCQIGDGLAHVYYPASDPWITSCGGTAFQDTVSAKFNEITWNNKTLTFGLVPKGGATGGGVSDYFDQPDWQKNAGVPASLNPGNRVGRGVPDIAGYANGYSIVWNGATAGPFAGTSETAPLYAGLIALVNGYRFKPVGYLNPFLYQQSKTNLFRDIADNRDNSVPFFIRPGQDGMSPPYVAGKGWDACTGLGVLDGKAILESFWLKKPQIWYIDPLALILGSVYVKLHLPDPVPDQLIAERVKALGSALTAVQRRGAVVAARNMAAYSNAVMKFFK
jgi:kumamolisin